MLACGRLGKDQLAAERAYSVLHLRRKPRIADDEIHLRERRDQRHAPFTEFARISHDDNLAGSTEHGSVRHGLVEVRSTDAKVGIASRTAEEQLVGGELLQHIFGCPAHYGCGVISNTAAHNNRLDSARPKQFNGKTAAADETLQPRTPIEEIHDECN